MLPLILPSSFHLLATIRRPISDRRYARRPVTAPRASSGCAASCATSPTEQGRTVLVSSHLLSEMEQTADRVVIRGRRPAGARGHLSPSCCSGADGAGTVLVRSPGGGAAGRRRLRADGDRAGERSTATRSPWLGQSDRRGPARAAFPRRDRAARAALRTSSGLEEIYFQLTAGQEQFACSARGRPRGPGGHPDDPGWFEPSGPSCSAPACGWGLFLGACAMVRGCFSALITGFAGVTQNGQPGIPPLGRRSSRSWRSRRRPTRRPDPDPRHHRDDPGVPAPDATPTFLTTPRRALVVIAKLWPTHW